jgi:protein phosphatase methylesterase 1
LHDCFALQGADGSWQWRTNLAASSPHWRGWYEGLSDAFLGLSVPKMLLLAGTDRHAV